MSILQDSYVKLKNLYSFSRRISLIDSAESARVQRTMLLEKMLEKILLHDHSILLLLSTIPDQTSELDVSMIASAARNIMETTNIYFHISQRRIDTSALKLRVETMVLNEIYNEIEITKKLGFSQNCEHAKINTWYFRSASQRFQKFPEFAQYSKNEKNQIVSGRKPAFQIKSPSILQEQTESAIYNLLSNSVHGLPLGLSSNSINYTYFFNSFFKAEQLLVISLQISRVYTAYVVKDYLNLRKRFYSLLTQEEKKNLKSYMSAADLENYICELRAKYEKDPFGYNFSE